MQQDAVLTTPCVCFRLRKASRALTRLYDEALEPTGLTVTQFSLLRNAIRLDGPTVAGLAEATGHERSAMWRTLQPLVREGLVTLAAGKDQRAQRVEVTEAGRDVVETALPYWVESQQRVREKLGPEKQKDLIRVLRELEALVD